MQNHIVVSTIIDNSSEIIRTFSKLPESSGCNIVDSQFKVLGKKLSLMLFLSGNWDAIAKIESMLAKLEKQHQIKIKAMHSDAMGRAGGAQPSAAAPCGVHKVGIYSSSYLSYTLP